MMKLILVSIIVIFIGACHGFPDGLEARDSAIGAQQHNGGLRGYDSDYEGQHFHVDKDQYLENGKAPKERKSGGNSVKKLLQRLETELQSVKENQNDISDAISNQDSMLDSLNSAISNQSIMVDSLRDCPIGFFHYIPSNQCFKLFADIRLNWTSADAKCRDEDLQLAQPDDPVSVQTYIMAKDGRRASMCWLGARGDGASAVWQHNGQAISNSSSYWNNEGPDEGVSTEHCLVIMSGVMYETFPPYYMKLCSTNLVPLCELVME